MITVPITLSEARAVTDKCHIRVEWDRRCLCVKRRRVDGGPVLFAPLVAAHDSSVHPESQPSDDRVQDMYGSDPLVLW